MGIRNAGIILCFALGACMTAVGSPLSVSDDANNPADFPKIRSIVRPDRATIGVPVECRVSIAGKNLANIIIKLPEKKEYFPEADAAERLGLAKKTIDANDEAASKVPLYIIHNARKDDSRDTGIQQITVIMEVSYYRAGTHRVPELKILGPENIQIGYQVPQITIDPVNKDGQFQDIEPPLDLKGNYTRLIILIGAVVAVTVGVVLLVLYVKKRRNAPLPVPMVTPIELFMDEINRLMRKKLLESERMEEFVTEISFIFRKYLSAQIGFNAIDMTANEILEALEKKLTPMTYEKYREDLYRIMSMWDLAKFAEFTPSADMLTGSLDTTKKIARRLATGFGDVRS